MSKAKPQNVPVIQLPGTFVIVYNKHLDDEYYVFINFYDGKIKHIQK